MAKRKKRVLPARKATRDDDSLLVRSAESLGRVIGSLQRQVRGTTKRATSMVDDAMTSLPNLPRLDDVFGNTAKKSTRTRKTTRKSTRGTRARATSARTRATARKTSKKR
jgi:hypothetical protein